jgi:hypothetical protein
MYLILRSNISTKLFYFSQIGTYILKIHLYTWNLDYMIPNRISHTSVQSPTYEFQNRNISSFQGNISSIQNYRGLSFLPVTFTGLADLFPQLGSWHAQLCGNIVLEHWWSSGRILASDARGPEFKSRVLCLLLFHDDILWSLGSNLVFIIPFGIL